MNQITHSSSFPVVISRRSRTHKHLPRNIHQRSAIPVAPGWSMLVNGAMDVCNKYNLPGRTAFETS
jgi:hypothetical protein